MKQSLVTFDFEGVLVPAIWTAVAEIVTNARKNRTGLIILGTYSRTGVNYLRLGSVAERVVRHASCPELVVREKKQSFRQ